MKIMFSSSEQLKNIYDEMSTLSTKQLNLNNSLSRHPSILIQSFTFTFSHYIRV